MDHLATHTSDNALSQYTFAADRTRNCHSSSCQDSILTHEDTKSDCFGKMTKSDKMTLIEIWSALPMVYEKLTHHVSSILSPSQQSDLDTPSERSNDIDTLSDDISNGHSQSNENGTFSGDTYCDETSHADLNEVTTPEDDDKGDPLPKDGADDMTLQRINDIVDSRWDNRSASTRYKRVFVLMIHWEESDLRSEIEHSVDEYSWVFEQLYKYEVSTFEIPIQKPHSALIKRLLELVEADSPETLFVIWYDGHASEHPDRRGAPRWTSYTDVNAPAVDSSLVATALADCEADILLVANACCSLTCDRFSSKGVVECISASAFNTITSGSVLPRDLTPSMTWAALKILRDKKCIEDGIAVPELHRRICLATQWAASDHVPDANGFPGDINWRYSETRPQPVYTRLSADPAGHHGATRNIVLRRLDEGSTSWHYMMATDLHIRIQLENRTQAIDAKQWADWILSAPLGVNFAVVEKPPRRSDTW
ncbi:hypothetical protein GGR57DRAFT_519374 [Xylariaceae sp. FL1272]|nr:hypothetical protein GGR57DRAFT_519374 [Xylariaceae sp. FL1272]